MILKALYSFYHFKSYLVNYWLLTTEYPPFHGGGISTFNYATAEMLAQKGHVVTVFIYDLSIAQTEITSNGNIRIVRFLPRETNAHRFLGFNAYISYEYAHILLQHIIKDGAPDVVESQEYHGIAYYLQQFKLLCYDHYKDLTILITCHAPSFICLDYNQVPVYQFPEYWIGELEKSCIRSADILVSPSRYFLKEANSRMSLEGTEPHIIRNPIALRPSEVRITRAKIICFGKLAPLKGTFELLTYFDRLWGEGFTHSLHIIGGTQLFFHPEAATMGDIVNQKYGHHIAAGLLVLHDEVAPEVAHTHISTAHVVLVPSLFDNLPYTVLEAMGMGKVVLASTQGGHKEVIQPGVTGFLFDHHIKNSFEQNLKHILQLSDSELQTVGRTAQTSIQDLCSFDRIYSEKISLINSYLNQKTSRKNFPYCVPLLNDATEADEYHYQSDMLLSVVIPYYNMGDYITDCVKSVLASDYERIEVIIIDDGSTTEKDRAMLSEIEATYPVTVFRKANEGLPETRNLGALKAKGAYMAFLDADDTVNPTYYSKAIQVLAKYDNVHFVGSWVQYFGESNDCWPSFTPELPYLLIHNMVNSSSLVYKKDSFIKAGLNDKALVYGMEDWDSVISMVSQGKRGVVLPDLLFNYRIRKDSMARQFTTVKRLYLNKYIAQKHRSIYNQYGADIACLLNANGSALNFDNPTFETAFRNSYLPFSRAFQERLKEKIKTNKFLRAIAYKVYKKIAKR